MVAQDTVRHEGDITDTPSGIPADVRGGAFILAARQSRGWSQAELARRTGINGSSLSGYRRGRLRTGNMRLSSAIRLLDAFGLDAGDLTTLLDTGIAPLRKARGWTPGELARRTGVSSVGLKTYERGTSRMPNMRLDTAIRLILAFGMRLGDAWRLLDEKPTTIPRLAAHDLTRLFGLRLEDIDRLLGQESGE